MDGRKRFIVFDCVMKERKKGDGMGIIFDVFDLI